MKSTTESSLCLMKAVDSPSFPAKKIQDLLLSQLFGTQIFVNKTNEGGKVKLHEMHMSRQDHGFGAVVICLSENMSERMSEDMSERMAEDMSERMSERMFKDMSEILSEDMSERMSKDMSERMSENMSERMSEDMSERMSEDMSERMAEDM